MTPTGISLPSWWGFSLSATPQGLFWDPMLVKKANISKKGVREVIRTLDKACFPDDHRVPFKKDSHFWIVTQKGIPIAYASMTPYSKEGPFFLNRVGVLPSHRGHGIQRILIDRRCRYAKRRGEKRVCTYAAIDNYASVNNLIRSGFRFYFYDPIDTERLRLWFEKIL